MGLIKSQAMDTVNTIPGVPEDKKQQTVETTANSLLDGLKQYAATDNLSQLSSLFGQGNQEAAAGTAGNLTGGLESRIVSSLTSQVGLDSSVATRIASSVIPAVIGLFKKNVQGSDTGSGLTSLLSSLTGKSAGSSGGVMDMLGGMFGKKS